jgi:hypothetical protein
VAPERILIESVRQDLDLIAVPARPRPSKLDLSLLFALLFL